MRDPLAVRAAATPDAPALVRASTAGAGEGRHRSDDGGPSGPWTYGDLDAAVEEVAGRLSAAGIDPGDHVAVLGAPTPEWIHLLHATIRLGAVLVPISTRLVASELRDRLERADVALLVAGEGSIDDARTAVDAVSVTSVDELPDPMAGAWPDRSPSVPALIMFTSGTTGQPNTVPLSLANLLASAGASAARLGVLPDDAWYVPLPTYHMGGLAPIIRSTLYGTGVILESGGSFDARRTLEHMATHRPTAVSLVPTMLRRLLDAGEIPDSLRFVLLGGAAAPDDLIRACDRRDVPVCPTYGLTETASQVATARPDEAVRHVGTVGRPLVGTTVIIVDEAGEPVETGETGELVVDGPTVTDGYYGEEDPVDAFDEYGFHTGDVGYRDDAGRLWIRARRTDRIVTGGENVDPAAVREVLRDHPKVDDAAVVGLPDPEWGERVGVLVVGDADVQSILAHCRDRLAGFKRPRTIGFVDSLPRTDSGTVDREAVRERLLANGQSI